MNLPPSLSRQGEHHGNQRNNFSSALCRRPSGVGFPVVCPGVGADGAVQLCAEHGWLGADAERVAHLVIAWRAPADVGRHDIAAEFVQLFDVGA
jgi:hypothetical protein